MRPEKPPEKASVEEVVKLILLFAFGVSLAVIVVLLILHAFFPAHL